MLPRSKPMKSAYSICLFSLCWTLFFGLFAGGILSAQEPVITQLIDLVSLVSDGTTLTIVFDDLRADASDTNFEAQHLSDITGWTGIAGSTITPDPLISDRFILTATDPGGPRKFYRIIGYSFTPGIDDDGDGLSHTFEGTLGALSSKVDSDFDGFSDGVELADS